MHYVYILRSEKTYKYYYGSTADLKQRLKQHNLGKVRSTKAHRPYILHYHEVYDKKSAALKRERYFKSMDGYVWLKENKII